MSDLERIHRYIKQTNMPCSKLSYYQMTWDDLSGLMEMKDALTETIILAFNYGKAKGYRAAKAEARRG